MAAWCRGDLRSQRIVNIKDVNVFAPLSKPLGKEWGERVKKAPKVYTLLLDRTLKNMCVFTLAVPK